MTGKKDETGETKMHQVRYGLFFDNHTQMENPDVGKDFDPEYFTDQLKQCGKRENIW